MFRYIIARILQVIGMLLTLEAFLLYFTSVRMAAMMIFFAFGILFFMAGWLLLQKFKPK